LISPLSPVPPVVEAAVTGAAASRLPTLAAIMISNAPSAAIPPIRSFAAIFTSFGLMNNYRAVNLRQSRAPSDRNSPARKAAAIPM
jgi:hypothetical protein